MTLLTSVLVLSLLGFANATPSQSPPSHWRRGGDVAVEDKWLDHNKIVALEESPGYDLIGEIETTFRPLLHSYSGCIPYPAVDANGNAGAGLRPTGKAGGDCRDFGQSGQVYARVGKSHGRWGVIYSWYLPKVMGKEQQHKHHWITAVVWLRVDGCSDLIYNFKSLGVAYSKNPQNSFDVTYKDSDTIFVKLNDGGSATNPIVAYDSGVPLVPSREGAAGALNNPLIDWHRLPQLAQQQLNGIQYEHTQVPFNDANFQGTLDAAYNDALYTNVPAESGECETDPTEADIDPDFGLPEPSSTAKPVS
ncbi:necrosis inducing protein [Colletotrichum scovillei]|uniref:Necrosis inducing protein n=1 Tax=Colletotrichum scovillei TaxID=1209932 RepID=A0A9P7UB83_9PEZI|nr:necrosis inducing protein [Colletotrichum scovillei]KAF4783854.1 necrosis inducing protein [Colletotrichum scovillei]KAG7044814.1 necrosis inducing protein [Colletotrichum scovillei]KAG7049530.1 necrosis inducing protein [Colletotrichum scovillei]KAG7064268.1 necrosis inducing protein [Colletotrichum scovillei]